MASLFFFVKRRVIQNVCKRCPLTIQLYRLCSEFCKVDEYFCVEFLPLPPQLVTPCLTSGLGY